MSAYLASQKTYDYIASGLYDAAIIRSNEHQYTIRHFLELEDDTSDEVIEQTIKSAVRNLYNLNRLALVTRYGDQWDRNDDFVPEIKRAAIIDPVQFIKCISCVLYQCSEYLTDETDTYKQWENLKCQLTYSRFVRSPEYDTAQWGMAA